MSSIDLKSWHKSNIVGIGGQGKSVLFRYLVKKYLEVGVRVILYDSEKQYADFTAPSLIVYSPQNPGDLDEFDKVCLTAYNMGRVLLAVESIDFYASPKMNLSPALKKIVHWGRMRGVGLLTTSRRPADVHKDICGLANNWFLFHLYIKDDIKWLKSFVGEIAESLKELPQYEFIHWTRGKATRHNPIPREEAEF